MFDDPTRTAVKICGLTNQEDAFAAVELGADALGFNTWQGTKRYLNLEEARPWLEELPSHVLRVALLVNADLGFVSQVAGMPFIDALQLHGDEDIAFCKMVAALGKPLIKAVRVGSLPMLDGLDHFSTSHLLLDAHVPGVFGGSGRQIDLGLIREFQRRYPTFALWLAGGLTPTNVSELVRAIRPRVVDVSSGVEFVPGRKDFEKMKAFISEVRSA